MSLPWERPWERGPFSQVHNLGLSTFGTRPGEEPQSSSSTCNELYVMSETLPVLCSLAEARTSHLVSTDSVSLAFPPCCAPMTVS